MSNLRVLIAVSALSLIVASLIHLEVLFQGYGHQDAGTAEAVIGAVMLIGLPFTLLSGRSGWLAGVALLAFGLAGTLIGVFTIIVGVGPRTVPDIIYHVVLLTLLVLGLLLAWRIRARFRREMT